MHILFPISLSVSPSPTHLFFLPTVMSFPRGAAGASPQHHHRQQQQQPTVYHSKADSNASSLSSRSSSHGGSAIDPTDVPVDLHSFQPASNMVYVAMGSEVKEWKANLVWVVQNVPRNKQITIVHVHQPSKTFPMTVYGVVGWVTADQVTAKDVAAYRKVETEKMNKTISTYMSMFVRFKLKPEKLIIESEDIAEGLLSLITKHGITELVMGAGADNTYSKTMKGPVSPTALTVQSRADPACKVWFVCYGKLISTREPYIPTRSGPTTTGVQKSAGHRTHEGKDDDVSYSKGRWPQKENNFDEMKRQRDDILEELHQVEGQRAALEEALADSTQMVKDLRTKLSEVHCLVLSLEGEADDLQQERACAVKEVNLLRERVLELERAAREMQKFCQFSSEELQDATNGFDNSFKIGEGGYGTVFKGAIHGMTVAIKLLNPQGMRGNNEFYQEMDSLSKLKHLNLSTMIGACPESCAVVNEFLENGSLEDHLSCKDNRPPLTWQARARIAAEICSALIFLHSTNKQNPVIHGDLKPSNVLLDSNFVSQLGDYGIWHALEANAANILSRCSGPMGSFVYMDPEFFASGELKPCSDTYSFGIVLLRLLTGRPALGILNDVQKAVEKGSLEEILDMSAGEWPAEVAKQIAVLGLRCCEVKREMRPDLATDAWQVLEPMINPPKLVDFLEST